VAVVRLFASARDAAGITSEEIEGPTVGDVLDEACRRYGHRFSAVLATSKVWVNGQPAGPSTPVVTTDVVAVLPPVSGGSFVHEPRRPPTLSPTPGSGLPVVRGNLALVPEPEPEPSQVPNPEAEAEPVTAPADRATPERPPLAAVHGRTRPHGRLGLAWAAVTVGVTVAGIWWLAAWLAVVGFVAATQTAGIWRKRGERPLPLLAAGIAAGLPVAASFGLDAVSGVVVGGLLATFVARLVWTTPDPSRDVALTLVIGIALGLAAASPVLMRHGGATQALLLLGFAAVYDAGAYLVGTGAASAWEGPAAGVAAFVPLTIFAAMVLVPPFAGVEPLVLGLLAALLAPIGPLVGSALLGDGTVDAPGVRRLDSLLVLGPIWTWCALSLLG